MEAPKIPHAQLYSYPDYYPSGSCCGFALVLVVCYTVRILLPVGLSGGQRSLQSSAVDSDPFSEGLRVLENCTRLLSTDNLVARAYYLLLRLFGKRLPAVQGLP
jgi:hypothetical protein